LDYKRTTGRKCRNGRNKIFEECRRLHKERPYKSYREEFNISNINAKNRGS
jgi:hypothetical protein